MYQNNPFPFLNRLHVNRGLAFGLILSVALLFFEIFNFSTTEFALSDLLGGQVFAGIKWSVILAIAFCGIDFAGIARIFTPEEGAQEPAEVWYLFGAWLLAAAMNAMLTWWGVSVALVSHEFLGSQVLPRETIIKVVPIFVATLVWLTRVLLIGSYSIAGDRMFSQAARGTTRSASQRTDRMAETLVTMRNLARSSEALPQPRQNPALRQQPAAFSGPLPPRSRPEFRPSPKPEPAASSPSEPGYQSVASPGSGPITRR